MRLERPDHTLQTTALINEAYLRLVDVRNVHWQNRAHFFALCARLMRRILVDYARTRHYAKRGGGAQPISLDQSLPVAAGRSPDLVAVDDALHALAEVEARKAQVVELRFFGGLAEALPWVLLHYPELDQRWLVEQARVHNLQNRLGFVVTLARELAQRRGGQDGRLQALAELEAALEESRLAREDTFCQESLSEAERRWLRGVRSPAAQRWNLLTDWTPETVRHA